MDDPTPQVTRRDALRLTGGAVGALGATGVVAGSDGSNTLVERVNIGYTDESVLDTVTGITSTLVYDYSFDAVTADLPTAVVEDLRRHEDVRYVERDGQMHTLAQTLPWGVDRVDADTAHEAGATGEGADIAIIDTGIDADHPDLSANLGEGVSFTGGFPLGSWNDTNGHGTHCAGVADAVNNDRGVVGISTEATLHAVKVMNAIGSGSTSDVARGIEWTANQGYDVGNLSIGSDSPSSVLKDAVEYATRKGVLLVTAAGNSGPCSDCVGYPASYPECVAVTATTRNGSLASYSSTGPEVDIAAPGNEIYSTYVGGYSTLSGTSMACPHVAGAAAQLMANGDNNEEARQRLKATAEDIGLSADQGGAGLLDVENAVLGTTDGDGLTDESGTGGGSDDQGGILGGLLSLF